MKYFNEIQIEIKRKHNYYKKHKSYILVSYVEQMYHITLLCTLLHQIIFAIQNVGMILTTSINIISQYLWSSKCTILHW